MTLTTTAKAKDIATLYTTHYSGTVSTLTLSQDSLDSFSLDLTSTKQTCGSMPSWLTFDPSTRTLYCSDEAGGLDGKGSLTALSVDLDYGLTEDAKTSTPGGGVSSVIYEGGDGMRYIAIAHYSGAAVSTYPLPLEPNTPATQIINYNRSDHGPRSQQDTPHPHEVVLDPTGSFILVCDLGSDVVRVYAIDAESGKLNTCPSIERPAGNGPRHGVFWTPISALGGNAMRRSQRTTRDMNPIETMFYMDSELGGTVTAFTVSYPPPSTGGCPFFEEVQEMVPYPEGNMPDDGTPAEIRLRGDSLYVSIRSDQGFAPDDSIATLARSEDGMVALDRLTSAYGKVPRTMVINRVGDLVAIGDQSSSNVAIVRRDPQTGELGEELADLKVGQPGKVGASEGLSSVIWAE
ncbi:hypothetical protein PHISCL_07450 [Aspergillus sclerotialis]|uniref:6-phosphogluconolactonase n=1 Tax=Aspergillus sclerotialis TaxID=2070753 RepID=A0A3A2ZT95_9EURO|nr:hypothetical protein PHISCL_07450 [Aspergillus sclerotialis]